VPHAFTNFNRLTPDIFSHLKTKSLSFKSQTEDLAKTPDLTGSQSVKPQLDFSEIISHHASGGNSSQQGSQPMSSF